MLMIGQNFKLRRLPRQDWENKETSLRANLGAIEGIRVVSVQPGLIEIEVEHPTARAAAATLARLGKELPDWRFSESSSYSLPTPVSLRAL